MGTLRTGPGRAPRTGVGLLRQPWVIALGAVTGINLGIAGLYSQPAQVTADELQKALDGDRIGFATALSHDRQELKDLMTNHRQQLEEALLRIKQTPMEGSPNTTESYSVLKKVAFGAFTALFGILSFGLLAHGVALVVQTWLGRSSPAEVIKSLAAGLLSGLLASQTWNLFDHIDFFRDIDSLMKFEFGSDESGPVAELKKQLQTIDGHLEALQKAQFDAATANHRDTMAMLAALLAQDRRPTSDADLQPLIDKIDRFDANALGQMADKRVDTTRMFAALLAREPSSSNLDVDLDPVLARINRFATQASGEAADDRRNTMLLLGALMARDNARQTSIGGYKLYCGDSSTSGTPNDLMIQTFVTGDKSLEAKSPSFDEQIKRVAARINQNAAGRQLLAILYIGSADKRAFSTNDALATDRALSISDALSAKLHWQTPVQGFVLNDLASVRIAEPDPSKDTKRAVQVCAILGPPGP